VRPDRFGRWLDAYFAAWISNDPNTWRRYSLTTRCLPSGRSRRRGQPANGWSAASRPGEQVSDPDIRSDVTLEHVSSTATEQDPADRRSLDPGHAQRGIQERHGERGRHADRVHRATALEKHGLIRAGRSSAQAPPPFPQGRRYLYLPVAASWADDRQSPHPANLVACTDIG
jgi:hypothetical protein